METSAPKNQPLIAIAGSTASGKTALGVKVAQRFNGEIINCDSVQVYRDIEIATAKPSRAEQGGIVHHLLDFVPAHEPYTAGDWAREATRIIQNIHERARLPVIVGGTGFYLRALCAPLFESSPTNEVLRERLKQRRLTRGATYLHRLLARVDKATAERLHPHDWSRTQRALELRFQVGETLSSAHRRTDKSNAPAFCQNLRLYVLRPPRAELYARINRRTVEHFKRGLVAEVEALLARGISPETTALGAHGYRRVVEYLRGERTLDSAIEQTQQDVRRYAKRQMTWFRREPEATWLDGFGDDPQVQATLIAQLELLLSSSFDKQNA